MSSSLKIEAHREESEHLNHIVEAAQRLNAIIGDILLYSKTLSGPSQLDIGDHLAAELVEDAVTALKAKAQ